MLCSERQRPCSSRRRRRAGAARRGATDKLSWRRSAEGGQTNFDRRTAPWSDLNNMINVIISKLDVAHAPAQARRAAARDGAARRLSAAPSVAKHAAIRCELRKLEAQQPGS
eukprot:4294061-Pleurochrysis_carterae.AAC.2